MLSLNVIDGIKDSVFKTTLFWMQWSCLVPPLAQVQKHSDVAGSRTRYRESKKSTTSRYSVHLTMACWAQTNSYVTSDSEARQLIDPASVGEDLR